MAEWFTVSKEGLEKIARRRGLTYVLYELWQNAVDTNAKNVTVTFEPAPNRRNRIWVSVEDDDPEGFSDLSQAYTLFAESQKKGDPTKRGRFCFGEKLVLSVCEEAEIISTKGKVFFDHEGRGSVIGMRSASTRREKGTLFRGLVKMSLQDMRDVINDSRVLISPPGVTTRILAPEVDRVLVSRTPIASFEATLQTEVADEEGHLKRVDRKTSVDVLMPMEGEPGRVFEMGIPVGWTDEIWDINVHQKVPVSLERDSVPDAYMRTLRVLALNAAIDRLPKEQASNPLVQKAIGDSRITPEALERVLTLQFGDKRAVSDPSDREAENRLKAQGYTIIYGKSLAPEVFENIRKNCTVLPAGQISPSYKPYSNDPGAKPRVLIPESEWTEGMHNIESFVRTLGLRLLNRPLNVEFEASRGRDPWGANFGSSPMGIGYEVTFNYARLGKEFFEQGVNERLFDLLIHELAHSKGGHLSEEFDDAMSELGAKMVSLALREPEYFKAYGWKG